MGLFWAHSHLCSDLSSLPDCLASSLSQAPLCLPGSLGLSEQEERSGWGSSCLFFFPDRRSSTSREAESSPALVSESVKWEISKETLGGSIFSPGMGLLGQSSVHMTPPLSLLSSLLSHGAVTSRSQEY